MSQAILRTKRVHLVPLSDEHLEYQVELDADPDVMRYVGGALTREQRVRGRTRRPRNITSNLTRHTQPPHGSGQAHAAASNAPNPLPRPKLASS